MILQMLLEEPPMDFQVSPHYFKQHSPLEQTTAPQKHPAAGRKANLKGWGIVSDGLPPALFFPCRELLHFREPSLPGQLSCRRASLGGKGSAHHRWHPHSVLTPLDPQPRVVRRVASVLTLHDMWMNPQSGKLKEGDVGGIKHRGKKISKVLVLLTL